MFFVLIRTILWKIRMLVFFPQHGNVLIQAKVELWPVFFTLGKTAFCEEKLNFSTLDEKSTIFILVSVVKTRGSVWKKKKTEFITVLNRAKNTPFRSNTLKNTVAMELLSRAIKQWIDQNYFGEINKMWPLERRVCFSAVNVKSALTLFAPLPSPPFPGWSFVKIKRTWFFFLTSIR